jgi:hypothetical protein
MTVRLKILMERGVCRVGCCGCVAYSEEEKASFPQQQDHIQRVGGILRVLRDRYGERLDISIVDPRNILAFWDNIRFRVCPSTPAWILENKKFFEGIPELDTLLETIDSAFARKIA